MEKRKTVTSSAVKRKYNDKTYNQVVFSVRKDSDLARQIEAYKADGNQLSPLIKKLLEEYFNKKTPPGQSQ